MRIYSMKVFECLGAGTLTSTGENAAPSFPACYVKGNPPISKCIMVSSMRINLSYEEREAMYLTSLEAVLSGYDVATFALKGGMYSVLRGVEDGGGKLHLVSVEGLSILENRRRAKLNRVLLTGGSVLSPEIDGCSFDGALKIALSISDALITTESGCLFRIFVDNGRDVALLRASLFNDSTRLAASDGCPIITTFSSFLEFPHAIAYKAENGRYGFGERRFDILTM